MVPSGGSNMAPRVKTECAQDCYKPRAVRTTSFLIFGLSTLAVLIFFALCVNSSRERPCSSSPYSPGEPADSCSPAPSMFTAFTTWSDSQYFVAAYLPTLLAVIYNILWEVIYTGLAEMEPFIQLAKDGGVSAQASLSLRYATTSLPVTFYLAIVNYHPNIICASFISFILAISVPFASEVLHIGTQGVCNSTAGGNNCTPYVQIRPAIARMEVVFTAITLFGVIALAYGYGNQTGIRNEGSSIAGLATLLNDTPFIETLRRISGTSSISEAERMLHGKYAIVEAQSSGTILLQETTRSTSELTPGQIPTSRQAQPMPATRPHIKAVSTTPLVLRAITLSSVALVELGLVVLILYYRFLKSPTGFEKFMDTGSMGVSFMMTAIGVLIKLFWTMLEKELRIREPYRCLAKGQARAEDTILVESQPHALIALFTHLLRRRVFLAYMALMTVLSEVLTVALAGIPFSSAQSYTAYLVSTYLSVSILLLMLIGLLLALFRRDNLHFPYPLDRMLSVLLYLCNSEILRDVGDLALMDTETRNGRILSMRRTYKYGIIRSLDGGRVYGIDYDTIDEQSVPMTTQGKEIEPVSGVDV